MEVLFVERNVFDKGVNNRNKGKLKFIGLDGNDYIRCILGNIILKKRVNCGY